VKERLGERIRRKRAEHKLWLRETATKVGISPTYLSRIETMDEKTRPAEDVIRKLATLLNDDFDELMQLAGRVPEDVEKVIKGDPSMPAFLRTAKEQKLSGDDLMKLIEDRQLESAELPAGGRVVLGAVQAKSGPVVVVEIVAP
jgi:transcriptional regulator with XRE-family HTH domain